MRRLPFTLAVLATVALFGACNCDTEEPVIVCETNEDCTEGAPYCEPESLACVACLDAEHCADGEVCTDFVCVAGACQSDDDCTEAGAEYCDTAASACVECVTAAHCAAGEDCVANACAAGADCDINGFEAAVQEGFYTDTSYGPLLAYVGSTSASNPSDEMVLAWWFDYGADYVGPGVYPVETNSNVMDCGLCLTIEQRNAAGESTKLFFAVEGEIEVTDAAGDAQPFNGVLRDVVFVEWDVENDRAVTDGETWCVTGHSWTTVLDGDLPPPPCTSDEDCTDPLLPYCNASMGECAECSLNEHCDEAGGEECLYGLCRVPGACYFNGFAPQTEQGFYGVTNDGPRLGYVADSSENPPLDQLNILWWFDYGVDWTGVDTYTIPANSNLNDCGLCVYVVAFDAQGEFRRLYFATEGEVEITEIGGDGEPFAAVLRNAVLVEWDANTDSELPNGIIWCIDEHQWSVTLDGTPPCLSNDDCSDLGQPLCDLDSGACVQCLGDADCGMAMGCMQGQCVVRCDASGFESTVETGLYVNDIDGETLTYTGATGAELPYDQISVTWKLDTVAYIGAGLYPIPAGATPADCGLCVQIAEHDVDGNVTSLYFAIAGTVEISEVDADTDLFKGRLHDVVFVQWDTDLNTAIDTTWCVDGYAWDAVLQGDLPAFACELDEQCTLPGSLFCNAATGSCVECLDADGCNEWSECLENVCVYACGETGFTPSVETATYSASSDLLRYTARTSADTERDEMRIEWWGSFGATFNGPGIYQVEEGSNYASCGLCLTLSRYDSAGSRTGYYFAIAGAVEITSVGMSGGTIDGVLHDVVFVEWGTGDAAVDGGATWCIDGMALSAPVPEGLPAAACTSHDDCTNADASLCNLDTGACVQCLADADCDEVNNEMCLFGECRVLTCDHDGFTAVSETIEYDAEWDFMYYLGRSSATDPSDRLTVEWYFDADLTSLAVGSYDIGTGVNDNYSSCSFCVMLRQGCTEDVGCDKIFFAIDGALDITQYGGNGSTFAGTMNSVHFVEVTIGAGYVSTPVAGGEMWCLDGHTVQAIMAGDPPGS